MTKSDSNKDLCLSYLRKYAEKDLKGIQSMFAENIKLRDWKIRVTGRKNALEETRKNFEAANSIKIEVLSILENKNSVAAELKINVDNTEELFVVDVITFNSQNQIEAIRAYLGRGDR